MENSIKIANYLLQHGIRPSIQRMAVMGYLMNHQNHPTVDVIYAALSPQIRTLSKTTVYNALNLFYEHGAVATLDIDEKGTRYDANCEIHGHFKCLQCGDIFDLFNLPNLPFDTIEADGFKVSECHICYKGYCPACAKIETESSNHK